MLPPNGARLTGETQHRPMSEAQLTLEFEASEAVERFVAVEPRVRPLWWTDADEADARSHPAPETPHLKLEPPEPDAPAEEWEPFNAECEEMERLCMEHYEANEHRWRCRTCTFWQSADGEAGTCGYEEFNYPDMPPFTTKATEGKGCEGYYPRGATAS